MDSDDTRHYRHIEVRRIAGALGAEIRGVDAARSPGDEVVAELRQALLDHLVIFLRGQQLTPPQLLAFAGRFGRPRMGSLLYAVETPPSGGDTLFASKYAAYDALSDGLKAVLARLAGVASSAKADVSRTREDRLRDAGAELKVLTAVHPVVRTHPETGRKALYVNFGHTAKFEGWSDAESAALLDYLFGHQVRPEFTCRFHWEPGSLAFWDNRCVQHNPVNDYHGHRRVMHRVTLEGDRPS